MKVIELKRRNWLEIAGAVDLTDYDTSWNTNLF